MHITALMMNAQMTDTPITDAFIAEHVQLKLPVLHTQEALGVVVETRILMIAYADFARKLERDRGELLAALLACAEWFPVAASVHSFTAKPPCFQNASALLDKLKG